jgi:hypothetical protein
MAAVFYWLRMGYIFCPFLHSWLGGHWVANKGCSCMMSAFGVGRCALVAIAVLSAVATWMFSAMMKEWR